MDFIIKTQRLLLRPLCLEDAPILNQIANQPQILKWMPDWKSTVEGTEKAIKYFITQYPVANNLTARVVFAVTYEGILIGMAAIGNKEEADNEIEVAYFISEDYAGKGFISEAVSALVDWAFANLKMAYLIAIVEPDNFPSQRVIEKSGFEKADERMILNSGDTEEKLFYYYRKYNKNPC